MKKIILLFLSLSINICAAQENYERLYPFKKNNLYGFIDNKGAIVVKPQYKSIGYFSEGLCAVVKTIENEKKLGYIDWKGDLVVDHRFQYYMPHLSEFKEGFAIVRLNNKSGYIDKVGEFIFPATLHTAHSFNEGFAVIEKEWGNRSIINSKGEIIFDPLTSFKEQKNYKSTDRELLYLSDKVSDGVITFSIDNVSQNLKKMGYFDMEGKMTFPFNYLISNYHNGLVKSRNNNLSSFGYLNKNGQTAIAFNQYRMLTNFKNDRAIVQDLITNKFGIINTKGDYIIQPKYNKISEKSYFKDIVMVVNNSNKWGYINSAGETIINFKYRYGYDFSEGLALVHSFSGKYQFIDKTGNTAFELDFKELQKQFKGGLVKVLIDGQPAYINKKGQIVFLWSNR